ncbi:cupin domain-containing protein [Sphingomonas sp. 1P06PA]|uniref:cupin domain-containing protein n=1 Tax=Sphingomonas sp. 1P06PA TaxID=554121 RepID=UPI0039A52468
MIRIILSSIALLTTTAAVGAQPAGGSGGGHGILLQKPADAKFMSSPGVPACTSFAQLHGDMSKGPATLMVRMKAGCLVPFHWHTPSEELIVLQGAPLAQMQGQRPVMLQVGSYSQLPSRHVHRFRCTSKVDCLIFLVADGPFDIHFVDDTGKEISTEAALAAALRDSKKKW